MENLCTGFGGVGLWPAREHGEAGDLGSVAERRFHSLVITTAPHLYFEALHDGFKEDHQPRTATEESLVHTLAMIKWKLLRLDNLEGLAVGKATESGDLDGKFLNNYSLYAQRMHSMFNSTLKTFHAEQHPRLEAEGENWRAAVLLHDFYKRANLPWDPASDEFVFSRDLLDKQLLFNQRWHNFMRNPHIYATTKLQDMRYSKEVL